MRIPDPIANTTTEAYLAYKAGYLEESELKPVLYEPYLHFDSWLAYWAGLTNTYPLDKNGDPEMLTDEEALVAYLSGVTDTYPEEIKDPYDVRIVGYLKHLASIRWPEPDYPVNNEEFYLSTMEPTHTSNSVPSSDIELDTAEGKFIDVKAYGDASQTTYSGKNLMNGVFGQGTYFSLTSQTRIMTTQSPQLVSGQAYTVSITGLPSGVRWAVNLMATPIYPGSGGTLTYDSGWKTGTSFTFTPEGNYYFAIVMGMKTETDISPSDISGMTFQLELGSSATSYEPYVGGTPAPNPDYPQAIQTVTGENVVKVVGKNLIKFAQDNGSAERAGVTITVNSNNTLTINGTATTNAWFELIDPSRFLQGVVVSSTIFEQLDVSQTYTLSANIISGGVTGTIPNITAQVGTGANDNKSSIFGSSVTFTGSDGIYRMWLRINTGNVFDNCQISTQLEIGSQATAFEPYTAQDYAISLTGKNLFNKATSTDGYRIDSNGDPYANASYFISDYIAVQPSTTYAYSRGGAGSGLSTIAYYKSDKTFISRTMPTINSSDTSGTVTTPNNAYYARFCDVNEVLDSAQLELGSTATEYEAYSPIELAKIGTYQDRIYKDGEKWYVERNVGKTTLDGSEGYIWNYNSGTYSGFYRAVDSVLTDGIAKVDDARLSKSNNFTCESTNTTWTGAGKFGFSSTWTMWFELMDNTITTYRDFNAWLSTHPTTFYYPLATPTTTEITNSELIAQLDALMEGGSYNGKTYIKVTANDPNLPALLKVEAYSY